MSWSANPQICPPSWRRKAGSTRTFRRLSCKLSTSRSGTTPCAHSAPELPLFVALDVCGAHDHTNPRKTIKDHVNPEDLIKAEVETKGGVQTLNYVNESGLYALIFGSKLESAKRFKK